MFKNLVIASLLLAVVSPAYSVVISPAYLGPWQEQNSTCGAANTGSTGFQTGPATPPLGTGSALLTVGANGDSFNTFRYTGVNGVLMSALTQLDYSTYVQTDGSGGQAPYLLLNVDYNGDTTVDDQLFFEPIYQSASYFPSNPQGPLTTGTWQTWDALNGGWWSLNGTAGATAGTGVKTLATIFAAQPNARIINTGTGDGGFRVASGCGAGAWDNFVGNFDAVNIGVSGSNTTFDFEAVAPVSDLAITKTGPSTYTPASDITYTITVTNNGPDAATGVTVTDTIPARTTFVSSTPSQGSCSGTTTVVCSLGTLAASGTATISLVVQTPSDGGPLTNTATVSNTGGQIDTTPANDAATVAAVSETVPTLSQWGLLALAMALAAAAVLKFR